MTFSEIEMIPCLILLGDPGIGKTYVLREQYEALANLDPVNAIWIDLKDYATPLELKAALIENSTYKHWLSSDYKLTIFIDSLDEGRLSIPSISHHLATIIRSIPDKSLSIRITCRVSDWSSP